LPYKQAAKDGMERLPKVIASTVVRSAHQSESHGGVYLVDLETSSVEQTIDYDDRSINWQGRGGDRGLRGIAIYGDEVYLAANNEVFVYSKDFRLIRSIQNEYLAHCHEIYRFGDTLFITSTGYDSVLEYDLRAYRFVKGYHIQFKGLTRRLNMLGFRLNRFVDRQAIEVGPMPRLGIFDPESDEGPPASNTCHINNVFYDNGVLFVSGTRCRHLLTINGQKLSSHARLPFRTHNARPFRDGVLMNDTRHDRVSLVVGARTISLPVKRYEERDLLNSHLPQDNARQAFGRGLAILGGGLIAGGSSPATISVYNLDSSEVVKTINLTMDVRNAIHGLEVWPF
jgi:hypothetical protein